MPPARWRCILAKSATVHFNTPAFLTEILSRGTDRLECLNNDMAFRLATHLLMRVRRSGKEGSCHKSVGAQLREAELE
jgi:hypothetical protein